MFAIIHQGPQSETQHHEGAPFYPWGWGRGILLRPQGNRKSGAAGAAELKVGPQKGVCLPLAMGVGVAGR
jgi:hypothetical protein